MGNVTNTPVENLEGFSKHAIAELERTCHVYRQHIIEESKNIERHERVDDGKPEIIVAHVKQATRNYRKGSRKKLGDVILNVGLDLLLLFLGFYFDKDQMLSNDKHLFIFLSLTFICVILTVFKYAKEV